MVKVERHQLDLLLDLSERPGYWVNLYSPRGYLAERLLLGACAGPPQRQAPQRRTVTGEALSYADWVPLGVLAINVMFSSLWDVGFVVVRYRKNGVLRQLKATPLRGRGPGSIGSNRLTDGLPSLCRRTRIRPHGPVLAGQRPISASVGLGLARELRVCSVPGRQGLDASSARARAATVCREGAPQGASPLCSHAARR